MFFETTIAYRIRPRDGWSVCHRDDLPQLLEERGYHSSEVEVRPIAEAPAEMLAVALGDRLESSNYHELVGVPERFLDALSDSGRTQEEKQELLLALARSLEGLL